MVKVKTVLLLSQQLTLAKKTKPTENGGVDHRPKIPKRFSVFRVAIGIGFFFVLLYLPLFLALFEEKIFDTNHIENGLQAIGVHETLRWFYEPVIDYLHLI